MVSLSIQCTWLQNMPVCCTIGYVYVHSTKSFCNNPTTAKRFLRRRNFLLTLTPNDYLIQNKPVKSKPYKKKVHLHIRKFNFNFFQVMNERVKRWSDWRIDRFGDFLTITVFVRVVCQRFKINRQNESMK